MARYKTKFHLLLVSILATSCRHEPMPAVVYHDGYPESVGKIFRTKCATSGCHNELSHVNAASLDMSQWEHLMKGGNTGAVIIPYRPDFSSLCYFINTDTSQGIVLQPSMPYNQPPLSNSEYQTIKEWITQGAPNYKGEVKYADDGERSKIYVANRQCDVVTVIDATTLLPMRYVDVGVKAEREYPYCIKMSPDKKHWYVGFFSRSDIIQRFDAATDQPAGVLNLGEGAWTSIAISADSKYGYFVDNSAQGKLAIANLEQMELIATYGFNGASKYPMGIALAEQLKKIYIGASSGNFIYCIDLSVGAAPALQTIPIDGSGMVQYQSSLNPTDILVEEGKNRCYIACERSKEVRVLDIQTNTILGTASLPSNPAFMALSGTGKLFVSCPDDSISIAGNRGSVQVINLVNMSIIKSINTGYQPYGLAINQTKNLVAVANANIAAGGPSSHHASRCGAKNGNVTFIDLNTLSLVPKIRLEVAVYPFGVTSR